MGVDLEWKSEDGRAIEVVLDTKMLFSRYIRANDWGNTMCLRFIDPYGDCVFNQLQIPLLKDELEASLVMDIDDTLRKHIENIISVLKKAIGQTHTYVWFVGD